jgi:Transcriptional regulators
VRAEPGERAASVAARDLLSGDDRPTAVFAAHDEPALGVLRALDELGLTTAQVAVVGYDDTEIAGHPRMSLTSVNQSGTAMGARAITLLLERIAGRTTAAHEVMEPRLMVRDSSTQWHPTSRERRRAGHVN